eukprot:GGOE01046180.1.p1 GENE.GGOE01046180.1~~GGOE01046180.1.p1  ORF type:complete len:470 (-),score=159.19 GGOE01046180.1:256-1665(-)
MASSARTEKERHSRRWVTTAITGEIEVQRLSRLAIFERAKQPYRFRILKAGSVLQQYHSKAEVEAALDDPHGPVHSRSLLAGFQATADLETPRVPPLRPELVMTSVPVPERMEDKPLSGSPRSADSSENLRRRNSMRRVSFHVENKFNEFDPEDSPSGSPMRLAAKEKASLSPEARAARRAALIKAPSPHQEPKGDYENVLAWYYDDAAAKWDVLEMEVRLAKEPFAVGSMRSAYKLHVKSKDKNAKCVAKQFTQETEEQHIAPSEAQFNGQDPNTILKKSQMIEMLKMMPPSDFEVIFAERVFNFTASMSCKEFLHWRQRMQCFKDDIVMQEFCRSYAKEYNKLNPPKKVNFLQAFLVVFHERSDQPVFACEPMLMGEFVKFTNNAGDVNESADRDTPHAFSHFSYVHSGEKHIIVDIQGFMDTYTDPQVHSTTLSFGLGNLGQPGIDAFFSTHKCNSVCQKLGFATL